MARNYDIETPYKPVLKEISELPILPDPAPHPPGDELDDLYQEDILQENSSTTQARRAEPGFAPDLPSPGSMLGGLELENLPSPFSPSALKSSIDLIDRAIAEREKLLQESISQMEARIRDLEANRKKVLGWELNSPDAGNRISHLERLITTLEAQIENRKIEFWKNVLPLREKRLSLEEELAEAEQLEQEIARIVWTA